MRMFCIIPVDIFFYIAVFPHSIRLFNGYEMIKDYEIGTVDINESG